KLKGLIRKKDGKVNITKAKKELSNRIAPKQQQSINARWGKNQIKQKVEAPATEEEVEGYLNETIGDLAKLDIYELQRRNELEKLLLAQIKRRKESGELMEAEGAQKAAFEAGKAIKEQLAAIADRTAPLVAAESKDFECKQIIMKEIGYILESLSKLLEVE
ncbi:MAG: hypothetical protein ACOCQI_05460, partial [Desulfosalsimonas sp.]